MPFDSLPVTSPALEKLRLGRALIETRGLARGTFEDRYGRVCAVGGITRQSHTTTAAMNRALGYLAKAIPTDPLAIAAWNDHPGRTKEDVLAAYDRAIDLAIADQLNG